MRPKLMKDSRVFVDYGVVGEPWHERYIVAVLSPTDAMIITPDLDIYRETLSVPPLRNLRSTAPGVHTLPAGLGALRRQPVYRFKGHTHVIPRATLVEARRLAEEEKDAEAGPGVEHEAEEEEAQEGHWLVMDSSDPGLVGTFLEAGACAQKSRSGDLALACGDDGEDLLLRWVPGSEGDVRARLLEVTKSWAEAASRDSGQPSKKEGEKEKGDKAEEEDDAGDDVRTLSVKWQPSGVRTRPFAEAVGLMEEEPFGDVDFPLSGPRVAAWMLRSIATSGTTPVMRHSKWTA